MRAISAKRNEPGGCWVSPERIPRVAGDGRTPWLKAHYDKLNYQDYSYYSAPSAAAVMTPVPRNPARYSKPVPRTASQRKGVNQLVPVREGQRGGGRRHFDSVSVALLKTGGAGDYFLLLRYSRSPGAGEKYIGTVVPSNDNFAY
ncbi:MAG: hypothetical protein ACLTXH_14355 [Enterobacter hormaechei]